MESAEATGWVGTDWIAQILLGQAGLETYNGVVDGSVPFTDPAVLDAWERWGQVIHGDGLVLQEVPAGVLATTFQASTFPPFEDPAEAGMVYLGSFAAGFITDQFPDAVPGEDVDFMPFPGGAITGDFNVAYMFNADEATCSFMEHIASAEAQQIWLERGGFTSANQNIDTSAYENDVERRAAEAVLDAATFAGDMDDLVGGQWQQALFQAVIQYMSDPGQLESLLESVNAARTD
jgi:alpha-glucoside transport system substrate-binding protein